MEAIVSLCKRRGFIFPGSDIYGGLAGTYDYGPLGVTLKKNIQNSWWNHFVTNREDMYGIDAAILMNPKAWEASGHVSGFSDPLVECSKCHKRYRADHVETETDGSQRCPEDNTTLGESRQFNMMFKTQIGAMEDASSISYLRPETAGGMFVNFKNVVDSFHPRLPFGLAQIGKAFRNEIAPRDFIFRLRELEQMEIEYFCHPSKWEESFEHLRKEFGAWMKSIGLPENKIHEVEIGDGDRAHYSKRTIDFEFDFPIGQKELAGLAYRTDFDLKQHGEFSKTDLSYFDEETKERFIPHCIEPSVGVERAVLAVISSAYKEEVVGDETRTVLAFNSSIAPIQIAVLPLSKKEELSVPAREIVKSLKKIGRVQYDETQSIGKRYRRQDEIGTPYCVTVDFDTLNDNAVTVRDRDTMEQVRLPISELGQYFIDKLNA
ncbi:MAG: glycine--tRNA ligase [Candidatus Paceibacterota bacterium]